VGALEAFGNKVFSLVSIPCIRAFLAENIGSLFITSASNNLFSAILAIDNRNRNAPFSLTGNTPVGSFLNH
jgi:hypothetical protein